MEDLLGRDTVDLRSDDVAGLVRDKVVLVTGAGGQHRRGNFAGNWPATIPSGCCWWSNPEGSLFNIESELNDRGQQHVIVPLVADILDGDRMRFIFERYGPQRWFSMRQPTSMSS